MLIILIIGEIQIKTAARYHPIHVRIEIKRRKKKKKRQVLARMWKNWNICVLLVGMRNGVAAGKKRMEIAQKTKTKTTI